MADGTMAGQWFVWERGLNGPQPVKYHDGITKAQYDAAMATYRIERTELLDSFGALSKKYPPPAPGPEDLWTSKENSPQAPVPVMNNSTSDCP